MPMDLVKRMIAERRGIPLSVDSLDDSDTEDKTPYSSIGRGQELSADATEAQNEGLYRLSGDMNFASNLGSALSQVSRGVNAPVENDALYKRMDAQNEKNMDLVNQDQNRTALVKKAIEDRKVKVAELARKQTQFDQQMAESKRHNLATEAAAMAAVNQKGMKNRDADALPMEDQETVKDLAKKNAAKISIANQIEGVMKNWDRLSDDQKIAQGSQLLKTLNSTEGADAIGKEEAERLGSFLHYKMFNLTNPGSFIGRDLDEFKKQAMGTAGGIREAIRANQLVQNDLYRRHGVDRQDPAPIQRVPGQMSPSLMGPTEANAAGGKVVVRKQRNKSTGEIKVTYSDGSQEIVDGN